VVQEVVLEDVMMCTMMVRAMGVSPTASQLDVNFAILPETLDFPHFYSSERKSISGIVTTHITSDCGNNNASNTVLCVVFYVAGWLSRRKKLIVSYTRPPPQCAPIGSD